MLFLGDAAFAICASLVGYEKGRLAFRGSDNVLAITTPTGQHLLNGQADASSV